MCWGTAKENSEDKVKHGTVSSPKGELHGLAKLTSATVKNIRSLADTIPVSLIAAEYEISEKHVRNLVKRKAWGWLS
ncbi:hypothetical protein [EBPR siphovirus 3]|nr:hypothetical protein [EBPR siphovirus 3]